jgi:tripartite-type tricarboxylate transporter receptor subunit TctC
MLTLLVIGASGAAAATDPPRWPQHAITLVAGNQAGSAADSVARLIAESFEAQFGVPVVVDNRSGVGGRLAAEMVAKAAPNGYTLLVGGVSNLVLAAAMEPDLRYDPVRDFVPLARKAPGSLTYVSLGTATTTGYGMTRFLRQSGSDMLAIEYKGISSAIPDVLAGRVDVLFTELGALVQHGSSGNLRALAIAWPQRVARLPQVPTTAEQGFPGLVVATWYGLLAPAGTPPDVIKRLNDAYTAAVHSSTTRKRIDALGYEPVDDPPGRFATALRAEIAAVRETLKPSAAARH